MEDGEHVLRHDLYPFKSIGAAKGHGVATWWEPAAALTCTLSFTASGVLQKLDDIFGISEIELQKGL